MPAPAPDPQLDRAKALRAAKRYREAEEVLVWLVDNRPRPVAPLVELAFCRMSLRDFDGGLAAIDRAIGIQPGLAALRGTRALLLLRAGRPDEAITEAENAVRMQPGNTAFLATLGEVLLVAGRYFEAREAGIQGLRLPPDAQPWRLHEIVGLAAAEMGNAAEGEAAIRTAFSLRAQGGANQNALADMWCNNLAHCILKQGRVGEAEQLLRARLGQTNSDLLQANAEIVAALRQRHAAPDGSPPELLGPEAVAGTNLLINPLLGPDQQNRPRSVSDPLIAERKWLDAIEVLRGQLADRHPPFTRLDAVRGNNLAWSLFMNGDPADLDEADRWSGVAADLLADHVPVWGTRGSVLVAVGKTDAGLSWLAAAVEANTEPAKKALNWACMAMGEADRGNVAEADRLLALATATDPDCPLLARAGEHLAG